MKNRFRESYADKYVAHTKDDPDEPPEMSDIELARSIALPSTSSPYPGPSRFEGWTQGPGEGAELARQTGGVGEIPRCVAVAAANQRSSTRPAA
jgi:hypothetical protein